MAALLLMNAEARLFNAATYKKALSSQNIYQRMPGLLAEQISTHPVITGYLQSLSRQEWENLITALIPPEQLQMVSEQSLDSIFGFLNGENENPAISIKPVKQTLTARSTEAITQILSTQPACSADQLQSFSLGLLMGQPIDMKILCNPPGELLSLAMPMISSLFNTQIALIPDAIPVFEENKFEIRADTKQLRMQMRLSPMLPLILLTMMTLFAARSLAEELRWWGISLIIAGAGSLVLILATGPISSLAIVYAARQENSAYLLRLAANLMDVVQAVLSQITTPMVVPALAILLIGVGMLIGAHSLFKNERRRKAA